MAVASSSRHNHPLPYPSPPPTSSLLFTPPPYLSTNKQDGTHHFPSPHSPLTPGRREVGHAAGDHETIVSLETASIRARARIKKLNCPWRQLLLNTGKVRVKCDAVLASVDILQKHVEMHVRQHVLARKNDDSDSDSDNDSKDDLDVLDPRVQCHWERCTFMYPHLDGLVKHIESFHISKLSCPDSASATSAMTPAPFRPILAPLPPLTTRDIPPYLITARPIPSELSVPRFQAVVLMAGRPSLRTRRSESSASTKIHPIMPIRDPDDYWPMNGEADVQLSHYWPSSSFFPRLVPQQRSILEDNWLNIQTKGTWVSGMPITSRKRTVLVDRPPIWPGADVIMRKRKVELGVEREEKKRRVRELRSEGKGKGKEMVIDVDGPSEVESKESIASSGPMFSVERITRSSRLRATRVSGRSVGIAGIEEMIAFEKRGVELGELPDYFSFQK